MSKYITTKEHPIFKEEIKFEIKESIGVSYDLNNFMIQGASSKLYEAISSCDMDIWLKKGYIKEVEKPEFTKSDVEEAIDFATNRTFGIPTTIKDIIEDWIKNRDK